MEKIIIFKEIIESLAKNPRQITLFGEKGLVYTKKEKYDLYYHFIEGIGHEKNLDAKYRPSPIFLWTDSEKELMEKFKQYNDIYDNHLAGTCGDNIFCLYPMERYVNGLEVYPFINHFNAKKKEFLEEISKNKGWRDFPEEIEKKIEELKNKVRILEDYAAIF